MHVKERERNSKTFSSTPAWLHFFTNSSSVHTYGDLEERDTYNSLLSSGCYIQFWCISGMILTIVLKGNRKRDVIIK